MRDGNDVEDIERVPGGAWRTRAISKEARMGTASNGDWSWQQGFSAAGKFIGSSICSVHESPATVGPIRDIALSFDQNLSASWHMGPDSKFPCTAKIEYQSA